MPPNNVRSQGRSRIRTFLVWMLGILCGVTLSLMVFILVLPSLVSTDWFRARLEREAGSYLNRPLVVERLHWTWSEGFLLEGVSVPDDPAFSSEALFSVKRVHVVPGWAELLRRRVAFDLTVADLRAHLVRCEDGRLNLTALVSELTGPPAEPVESVSPGLEPIVLPLPLQGRVRLDGGAVFLTDRLMGTTAEVHDLQLDLEMFSPPEQQIRMRLSMDPSWQGRPLPPVDLSLRIQNLLDGNVRLDAWKAVAEMEGSLPGVRLALHGGLGTEVLYGNANVDLAVLGAILAPFLGAELPVFVSGFLESHVSIKGTPGSRLDFETRLSATEVALKGGGLKDTPAGPVSFAAYHSGYWEWKEDILSVLDGEVKIQTGGYVNWVGSLRGVRTSRPELEVTLGPVSLDMAELVETVRPILPPEFLLEFTPAARRDRSALWIETCRFAGPLSGGSAKIILDGLVGTLPGIRVGWEQEMVEVEGLVLRLVQAEIDLDSSQPKAGIITGGLRCDGGRLVLGDELRWTSLDLPFFTVTAADLRPFRGGPLGMTGRFSLKQAASIDEVIPGAHGHVRGLEHALDARCALTEDGRIRLDTLTASLSAAGVKVSQSPAASFEPSFDARATLQDATILMDPLRVDVPELRFRLDMGDFLHAELGGEIGDSGFDRLNIDGLLTVRFQPIRSLLSELLPRMELSGAAEIRWAARGNLRDVQERAAVLEEDRPLVSRVKAAGFMESIEAGVRFEDMSVRYSPGEDRWVLVSGIDSAKPVEVDLGKDFAETTVQGGIHIGRLDLHGFGEPASLPIDGVLTFAGRQEHLQDLRVTQSFRSEPLDVAQSVEVRLEGLDRWLDLRGEDPLQTLLLHTGGRFLATLDSGMAAGGSRRKESLVLTGRLSAGAEAAWDPAREVRFRTWMETPALDVALGDLVNVFGLRSDVVLDKRYLLTHAEQGMPSPGAPPLSREVLEPGRGDTGRRVVEGPVRRRMLGDLKGRTGGAHTLSFESARVTAGPFPVDIAHHELSLRWLDGLPSADAFRMDVLGGTLVGSAYVTRAGNRFVLDSDAGFSGLNANALLPQELQGITGPEAEISGRFKIRAPVHMDPAEVLQHMILDVALSHIGSRALERFLYALDPYESNETVVRQRRLLRLGGPRAVQLRLAHGALSLSGRIEVQGVSMDLPGIDRMDVSGLPMIQRLNRAFSGMETVRSVLEILAAAEIRLEKDGGLRFILPESGS